MPKVGKKDFPYTKTGIKAASSARARKRLRRGKAQPIRPVRRSK